MADDPKPGGRSRFLPWIAALLVIIPILYVLSAGPVMWLLLQNHFFSRYQLESVLVIYAPLEWLYDHCAWFKIFMDAYMKLFGFN